MYGVLPSLLTVVAVWTCGANDPNDLPARVGSLCQRAEKELEDAGVWRVWKYGNTTGVSYQKEWPDGSLQWWASRRKLPGQWHEYEFKFEYHSGHTREPGDQWGWLLKDPTPAEPGKK